MIARPVERKDLTRFRTESGFRSRIRHQIRSDLTSGQDPEIRLRSGSEPHKTICLIISEMTPIGGQNRLVINRTESPGNDTKTKETGQKASYTVTIPADMPILLPLG